MSSESEVSRILQEIRDLLQEQVQLLRASAETSKQRIEQADQLAKRSVELQELGLARSRSNWKLYRVIVAAALSLLAAVAFLVAKTI